MKFQSQTRRVIGFILLLFIASFSAAAQDAPLQARRIYASCGKES